MRKTLAAVVVLVGAGALAQAPKPPAVYDKTKGAELKAPYTTKVEVQKWQGGIHRATYQNAHATFTDVKNSPKGDYRFWKVNTGHVDGGPTEPGWRVVEADGTVWVVFECVTSATGSTYYRARPAKPAAKKP